MLIRPKTDADAGGCLELLQRVRAVDGYPLHLKPEHVAAFFTAEAETAAWVADVDGRIVGHVALHSPADYPTLAVAQQATGLPSDRLTLLARLFTSPDLRRTGLGRTLLRHATEHARSLGQRAVLDVGQSLLSGVALYEAEGWRRVGELHLPLVGVEGLDDGLMLDLWVYVSPTPEPHDA